MSTATASARSGGRRRGRPPGSDGAATTERLLDAATAMCAERGFDGSTLTAIAERAGVSSTAVYNHFDSREDLLYAAAVRAIAQLRALAHEVDVPGIAAAYLRPEMRENRRLLAELHLASARDARIAGLLAQWHRDEADALFARLGAGQRPPLAAVKTIYLVLLGLCHLDDVSAVEVSDGDVAELAGIVIEQLLHAPSTSPRSAS